MRRWFTVLAAALAVLTAAAQEYGVVDISVCNLRVTPDFDAEMASQALLGTPVHILAKAESNDWPQVQTPDTYTGWVHRDAITLLSFDLSDADYEDFIVFAKGKEFDYRSSAKTYFDRAKEELKRDGLDEVMKEQLDALDEMINMEKEDFLYLKSSEIIPFIEEEIAVRYYFQEAGVKIRIRYDDALRQAIASERIKQY